MIYSKMTIHEKINNKSWWGLKNTIERGGAYTDRDMYSTYTRADKKKGVTELKRMGRIK